jgi:Spy/CpxP family protein refolding chaperone
MIAVGTAVVVLSNASLAQQGRQGRQLPPGGPRGPGGPGGPSVVLFSPVQKELKLTESQKSQLKKLESRLNQKRRQAFAKMRDEEADPQKVGTAMETLQRELEKGISEILDKGQRVRLTEIELQRDGLLALAKPEIAKKLKLTSDQSDQVKKIVEDMRQEQLRSMPPPPRGGFRGPGGGPPGAGALAGGEEGFPGVAPPGAEGAPVGEGFPGGPPGGEGFPGGPPAGGDQFPGGGPPRAGGVFPDDGPPDGQPGPGDQEFRARFAKLRREQEKIRSTAMKQLAAVLTSSQKSDFDKMQGKPFDLSSLRPGLGAGAAGSSKGTKAGSRTRPQTKSRRRNQQETADPGEQL